MHKEEDILFPWIRRIENGTHNSEPTVCKDIRNPIAVMKHEHDNAEKFLKQFRELTNNYTPFEKACPTARVLLQKLDHLENDMQKHVHKEDHVLFPRVIKKIEQESILPDHLEEDA